MGSMRCFCGYGMRNSDSINQIELSLFKLDDVKSAIEKGVKLKDLPYLYDEIEVWRCPVCGRWDFVSSEFNYRMVPAESEADVSECMDEDDVVLIEYDLRSANNAFSISGEITVSDFLKLDEDFARIRYLRVNPRRMLLYRDSAMLKPVKCYKQEK